MTTYLLDANVLIALVAREHIHHPRVATWATEIEDFAVCPVVEGAWVRFALRVGMKAAETQRGLRLVQQRHGHQFWPDSLSYVDASLDRVRGHRQVTDAYLVALAAGRPDARLATLDEALAQTWPEVAFLVPDEV